MAKKFGKFLLFTAAAGAVAAGAYYYFQNKEKSSLEDLDDLDDLDDFSEEDLDADIDKTEERSYVSLSPEKVVEEMDKVTEAAENSVEKVEEFFDDDTTEE